MAIAEKHLRERFGAVVCDHRMFGICSDGDLMEGISHEAASLAGHMRLGRLVFVYDDNHITIDGDTELTYSDNVAERFAAYGWHVVELGEVANDVDALEAGLRAGIAEDARPSLLILRSHIGYPSPKVQDTAAAHGNPLGADEVARVKEILGLPATDFYAPDDVVLFYREAGERGAAARTAWEARPKTDEYEAAISGAACTAGRASSPRGKRARRSRRAARSKRCSRPWSTSCPACSRPRATSPATPA